MNTKSLRLAAAGLTGALALTIGMTAGSAGASVTRVGSLARQKAVCTLKVDQRVDALGGLQARIDATGHLTADQKAPIDASIAQSIALLNTVYRQAIAQASTKAALNTACQSVYIDLRIFVVYLPQEIYTGDLDALGNFGVKLQTAVDTERADGTDTTADQALLDDATAKMADAQAKIASVSPASYNADPAGTKATWDAVRGDVFGAFGDEMHVRSDLMAANVAI